MKRILAILLCLVMCCGVLVACGDESESTSTTSSTSNTTGSTGGGSSGNTDNSTTERPYNYNMEEYITLPNYKEFVANVELDRIQQHIDSQIMEKAVKSKRLVCMKGDVVNVSYTGYRLNEDGTVNYDDVFSSSESYGVYIGSHLAIADFEDSIVGMSIGEDREFLATFSQDYYDETLAGKTVCFVVILNAIYDAPIYDNDFVYALTQEYTAIVDFEESLKENLILSLVYNYIVENAQIIKYPQKEYDELAKELQSIAGNFEAQYGMTLDNYIMLNYGKTREEYIESEIKTKMIYHAIAQAENVEVTSQMITSEKTSLINYYWQYYMDLGYDESRALQSAKDIVADLGENYLYTNVLFEQVESLLPRIVTVNEIPATYKSITQVLAERESIKTGDDVGDLCPSFDGEIFDENGAWGTTVDPTKNVGKITIINFWGTWCGPCKSELPDFDRIATDFADVLTIYAIHSSYGYRDASSYVEKNFASSKIVFLKDYLIDEGNEYSGDVIFGLLGGEGSYPYTLILDQDGKIVYKHTGMLSYDKLALEIEKLLTTDDEQDEENGKDETKEEETNQEDNYPSVDEGDLPFLPADEN